MKNKLLFFISIFSTSFSFAQSLDIFENNRWIHGSSTLEIHAHKTFLGYDHSLSYSTQDGMYFNTDMCNITAPNTLQCSTNDTVVVDAKQHSATLNNASIYYEEGFQPKNSPLSGTWHTDDRRCDSNLFIPYAEYSATSFYPASISSAAGFQSMLTFYLAYAEYSHELYFSTYPGSISGYVLYDKDGNKIEDINDVGKVVKLAHKYLSYETYDYTECFYVKD